MKADVPERFARQRHRRHFEIGGRAGSDVVRHATCRGIASELYKLCTFVHPNRRPAQRQRYRPGPGFNGDRQSIRGSD
jgi:hypothetical protein